jgi:alkylated DNA repair dioxygenase AlkB
MCFGGDSPQQPAPPPPPPAPPPVLEQVAPQTSAPKQSDNLANQAAGTKKYRTGASLGISTDGGSTSSGLSIPS